jgi:hypothetical protein
MILFARARDRLLAVLLAGSVFFLGSRAANAAAAEDCPPGSLYRSMEGFSWCEPTVCQADAQCAPNEVCRSVGLCMQVGALTQDAATLGGDAGKRLVVTQRCAPDKTCPQATVCSEMGRCLSRATADKMGILTTASSASPASSDKTPAAPGEKKSACGCRAVGASVHGTDRTIPLAPFAFLAVGASGRPSPSS